MMVTSNKEIVEETVIEILSRLPVKSLIRYRCACKSWYSLVKDPKFISKHLNNDENTRLVVIYTILDETNPFAYLLEGFHLYLDETLSDLSSLDLNPLQPVLGTAWGPYDGIFCIFGMDNRLTLWNPATKESRCVPKSRIVFPRFTKIFRTNVGFGRDHKTNEYKLVLIFTLWDIKNNKLYDFSHAAVYTLSTNSWRYFECFISSHYHMPSGFECINLYGDCYWILELRSNSHRVVLSFHMGDEVFQEIQGPCLPESVYVTLGLYEDCISLLVLDKTESFFEIWMMKHKYWTKILTVGSFVEAFRPLGFWKSGAFFIETRSRQMILYDPRTEEKRDFGLRSSNFEVYNYTESLIPIKGDDCLSGLFDIPWHILDVSQSDSY